MTVREIVLNGMPSNLTQIEKAHYIYIRLGELLVFSTRFKNSTTKDYVELYSKPVNSSNLEYNQVTCSMWSKVYEDLLHCVGINETYINNFQHHTFVTFKIDGVVWKADATQATIMTDLACIQFGRNISYFGPTYANTVDQENVYFQPLDLYKDEIERMDKNIPSYRNRKERHKEIINQLQLLKTSNLSTKEKLDNLFNFIGVLSTGYYESKDYIHYLVKCMLTEEEQKNVKGRELRRTNEQREVDILQCISLKEGDNYYYYLLSPNKSIKPVDKEFILQLKDLGFGIGEKGLLGISNYNLKFVAGKVSKKSIKFRLFKKNYKIVSEYDENQIQGIRSL